MFSAVTIAATSVATLLLCPAPSVGYFFPARSASAPVSYRHSLPRRASTCPTMAYAPSTVQDAWDNHFSAFDAKDLENILLDYDDNSVITTYDQTTDKKEVFKGIEGARSLFEGLFEALSDQSDLAAPMIEVAEDSNMVFLIWRCPASGFLDATDTFVFDADTKKIYRQNVAYRTL